MPSTRSRAAAMKSKKATTAATYKAVKPQAAKKDLRKLGKATLRRLTGASKLSSNGPRIQAPRIYSTRRGCAGLVLGQAPPAPPSALPRGWRPLAGPAEQRLAKLAGLRSSEEFWKKFDRANLLTAYPGLKGRAKKHDVKRGYKKHTSDGDVFPLQLGKLAASKLDLSQYRSTAVTFASRCSSAGQRRGGSFRRQGCSS
eukprot:TRINITY_DN43939_c0_g1_i2.p1 TRINITY_DN43939_c0_g1~~TRINITY_DN43939_c0_g1_i2.p1  ORF type:complete len:199 (+),score=44.38 TRINITY_DN43939_c0_g1_i2:145-741(+)